MSVRTTKKHFKLFEKECRKWLGKLGLKDWCVRILHDDLGSEEILAQCLWKTEQRIANLLLNKVVATSKGVCEIKRAALHECLELLLCGCTDAMRKAITDGIVDRETHKVIRTLENVLMGDPR